MSKAKIALLSAGEMGGAIAQALTSAGWSVATDISGRGAETRERASAAGMQLREGLEAMLADCDLYFSILPPSRAYANAQAVAEVARRTGRAVTFVECNAISPKLCAEIAALFEGGPVKFVDAGIIGMPPGTAKPRLYISGPDCAALLATDGIAYDIRPLGPEIGRASGMKMTYASMTKGVNALLTAAFLTADRLDLLDELVAEFSASQGQLYARAASNIARLPADAGRWAYEMEQIAQTYSDAGLPDGFHQGAAAIMRLLDASEYGDETRRTRDKSRTAEATIRAVAADIGKTPR